MSHLGKNKELDVLPNKFPFQHYHRRLIAYWPTSHTVPQCQTSHSRTTYTHSPPDPLSGGRRRSVSHLTYQFLFLFKINRIKSIPLIYCLLQPHTYLSHCQLHFPALVIWYTHYKLAYIKVLQNFWLTQVIPYNVKLNNTKKAFTIIRPPDCFLSGDQITVLILPMTTLALKRKKSYNRSYIHVK